MKTIVELLKEAVQRNASDFFIIAGCPVSCKIYHNLIPMSDEPLKSSESENLVKELYELSGNHHYQRFLETGDDDFSFSIPDVGRFRVNVYMQRGSHAAVLRIVQFALPDANSLHIPEKIMSLAQTKKGLILVSGPAGSGKSTTLACLINEINLTRSAHIITIEDPIEYLHRHKKSIVSQREVYQDTRNYTCALRAALREAPEVIQVGEMRDLETIQIALTAAETGHLILSTLHTIGAANTIDRIIDVFQPSHQAQIRVQLSMVIHALISEQLIPDIHGNLIPVFEIMIANPAIRTQIRDGKTHMLENSITAGKGEGMITMDDALYDLACAGTITRQCAISYSTNTERMSKRLK